MDIWWQLPSNQNYLNGIGESVGDGQCIIVHPYSHSPSGLEHALAQLLAVRWDYHVTRLRIAEEHGGCPVTWLYEQVVNDLPPEKPRDLQNLAREPNIAGGVILLSCAAEVDSRPWIQLLERAQAAFRSLTAWERPRLVLCLSAGSSAQLPAPDSNLSVRVYEPACHLNEMRYLAASIDHGVYDAGLVGDLRVECAVQLALWDVALCEELMRCPLDDLLSPLPLLRDWGRSRGWGQENGPDSHADCNARLRGWLGFSLGAPVWHSAWLAIQGRDRDIQRRLWKAQNSVIFPYIEEMRVDWIEKNGRLLEPPFATFSGEVCDPADLEIGQLYFFLKPKWGVLSQADRASLLWMRDARHQLAHLETLPISFIRKTGSPFSAGG